MSGEPRARASAPVPPPPRWLAWLHQAENWLLVLVLAAMVLLPVSEILRRMGLPIGIHGADDFLRHLTLLAGMLGGAIAARENRLLALSSLPQFLTGWRKRAAAQVSGVFSALVTLCLACAAEQFVLGEKETGNRLPYDIPTWWWQAALPAVFGVIVLRLLWHSAATWRGRVVAVIGTAAACWLVLHPPLAPARLVVPALVMLVFATVLGAPIFVTIGGAAAILFW